MAYFDTHCLVVKFEKDEDEGRMGLWGGIEQGVC